MGQQADIHTKILNSQSTDELMGVYDGWAERYDRELLDDWGYSPERAVSALAVTFPWEPRTVLKLAVAQAWSESCSQARSAAVSMASTIQRVCWPKLRKAVYRSLSRMDMNQPLRSRMVVTTVHLRGDCSSHVQPQAIHELIRTPQEVLSLLPSARITGIPAIFSVCWWMPMRTDALRSKKSGRSPISIPRGLVASLWYSKSVDQGVPLIRYQQLRSKSKKWSSKLITRCLPIDVGENTGARDRQLVRQPSKQIKGGGQVKIKRPAPRNRMGHASPNGNSESLKQGVGQKNNHQTSEANHPNKHLGIRKSITLIRRPLVTSLRVNYR